MLHYVQPIIESTAARGRKQHTVLHLSQVLLAADDRPEVDARSLISAPNLSDPTQTPSPSSSWHLPVRLLERPSPHG